MNLLNVVSTLSFLSVCFAVPLPKEEKPINVDDYLTRYGYLEEGATVDGVSHSDASRKQAIRDYQAFNGLDVTGEINEETIKKMRQPRCGVKDVSKPAVENPANFVAIGTKWPNKVLTWMSSKYTDQLSKSVQRTAMANALKRWSDVTPLKFEYAEGEKADIDISFETGEHGDGKYNAFDGRGGVLAHAFFPTSGETHFDDEEKWVFHSNDGTELETVAAHEFGHTLGLSHSNNAGALMAPYYQGYVPAMKLHEDDVKGIQSIYGKPEEKPTTTRPSITSSSPEKPTIVPCNLKIDAITRGPDGFTYIFRRQYVYKLGKSGLVPGYPQLIRSVFPKAPAKNVGAAVHIESTEQTILFKGTKGWVFRNFKLEQNFTLPVKVKAAFALKGSTNTRVYLFEADNFYDFNYNTLKIVPGYPLKTSIYWGDLATKVKNLESAIQLEDSTLLLFKGYKYFKFDPDSRKVFDGYPKRIVTDWLGQKC